MSSRRAFSLHRRHCLRALGGAAALLGLPPLPFGRAASAAQASRKYSKKVVDLVERSLVIDMLGPLKIDFRPEAYSEPLTEQEAAMFREPKDVKDFYQLGLRCAQLTYNTQNLLGSGSTERIDGGITDYGAEIIKAMNEVGMLIDVS